MVKTNRSFKDKFMIIEFEINVDKDPSITSSKDLEECFAQLIGFTAMNIEPKTVIQAFTKACKSWNIKAK